MKQWPTVSAAALCALLASCGSDDAPSVELPASGNSQPEVTHGQSDARVAECDGAAEGKECGEEGKGYHCIFDACVRNACGDGVVLERDAEECDDGNERDGDGCSATCKKEVMPGCGNELVEPGEECDDGNTSDDDRCTAHCKRARCGDGIKSAGEECDDGNLSDDDACTRTCRDPKSLCGNRQLDLKEQCDDGNAVMDDGCRNDCTLPTSANAGSGASGSGGEGGEAGSTGGAGSGATGGSGGSAGSGGTGGMGGTTDLDGGVDDEDGGAGTGGSGRGSGPNGIAYEIPECAECRQEQCHDVLSSGIDAIASCFTSPTGAQGPADAQLCIDVLDCAFTHDCAYGAGELNGCWCTASAAVCQSTSGLDANRGVCFEQILAATKVTSDSTLTTRDQQLDKAINRISQEVFPSGAAYWLVSCDIAMCPACKP